MSRWLFSLSLIIVLAVNAQSAPITFQSAPEQTALLELYTSEGCSSCPPAETWLSGLKESSGLWMDFVPVAFHVDYWDYLGWRDAWATPAYSDRQRIYATHWRSDSIYTPGFVLNGKEWRDWTTSKDGPKHSDLKVGVLSVTSSDTNRWSVSFKPAKGDASKLEVHAVLLAGDLVSSVKAGENRGHQLRHDFAVLNLVNGRLPKSTDAAEGEFVLPAQSVTHGTSLALAVWVTKPGRLESLQATGGWLVRPPSVR